MTSDVFPVSVLYLTETSVSFDFRLYSNFEWWHQRDLPWKRQEVPSTCHDFLFPSLRILRVISPSLSVYPCSSPWMFQRQTISTDSLFRSEIKASPEYTRPSTPRLCSSLTGLVHSCQYLPFPYPTEFHSIRGGGCCSRRNSLVLEDGWVGVEELSMILGLKDAIDRKGDLPGVWIFDPHSIFHISSLILETGPTRTTEGRYLGRQTVRLCPLVDSGPQALVVVVVSLWCQDFF